MSTAAKTPRPRAARTAAPAPRKKPAAAAVQAPAKPEKRKLVRDSFTIPADEYDLIGQLKKRALALGREAKKSELLRAGLKALQEMADRALAATLAALPAVKTGRPKAKKATEAKKGAEAKRPAKTVTRAKPAKEAKPVKAPKMPKAPKASKMPKPSASKR